MENDTLILAVDGGGSTTQVALYDMCGNPVLEEDVGSLSLKSCSHEDVVAAMRDITTITAPYGGNIKAACFGISGMDTKEDVLEIGETMSEASFAKPDAHPRKCPYGHRLKSLHGFPILLCSDAILPLFANSFTSGVVVISGTGSIALRIDEDGSIKRIGGWGYAVSDEGSGTWIGQQLIKRSLHVADYVVSRGRTKNRQDNSLLLEAWRAVTGRKKVPAGKGAIETVAHALQDWSMNHSNAKDYAALARSVVESRCAGCREISAEAQAKLGGLASLGAWPKCNAIVFSGGIFRNKGFAKGTIANIELPHSKEALCPIVINELPASFGAYKVAVSLLPNTPKPPKASSDAVRKSMQGNKGANTKPELLVRKKLAEAGIKGYRLHWKAPGKPDIAWPGKKVCIFINGCFWHRHEGCEMATVPKSNTDYWVAKFDRNVERDYENLAKLEEDGWRVHTVWECELAPDKIDATMRELIKALRAELG